MSNYTDQQRLTSFLKRQLTPSEAGIIKDIFDGVDSWIDRETGFSWKQGDAGEQRYYLGGNIDLYIDPVSDITAVEWVNRFGDVVYSYTADTDYLAFPLNNNSKTYLRKLNYIDEFDSAGDGPAVGRWPQTGRGIRVTGTFGEDGGVPGDIAMAATILAADWLRNTDMLQEEEIEGYRRRFWQPDIRNPKVDAILQSHKRILL